MSNNFFEKKDLSIRETFYNLCKDFMRYLDRKIVKKYIQPNQAQIPKDKKMQIKKQDPNIWTYFYEDDDLTEEDIIKDVFKDNIFIGYLQKLNQDLELVINYLDNNKLRNEELKNRKENNVKHEEIFQNLNTQINNFAFDGNNYNKSKNENMGNCNIKQDILQDTNIMNTINLLNMVQQFSIPNQFNNSLNNLNNSLNNNMNFPSLFQTMQNFNNNLNNNLNNNNCLTNKKSKKTKILDSDSSDDSSSINNISSENEENIKKENIFLNKKTNRQENSFKKEENSEIDDPLNFSFGSKIKKIKFEESLNNKFNQENTLLKETPKLESILQKHFSLINEQIKEINNKKIDLNSKTKMSFLNKLLTLCNDKNNKNKNIQGPYMIGSFSHINPYHLKISCNAIDLLFKCYKINLNNKKNEDLVNETIMGIFGKKLGIKYQQISKCFENNFLKIKIKYDNTISFNLYFIEVDNFGKETEQLILNNKKYEADSEKEKKLLTLYLFFRNWRKKYKLSFIIPEAIDEIINIFYDDNEKMSKITCAVFQILYNDKDINKSLDENKRKAIKKNLDFILNTDDQKKLIIDSINNSDFFLKTN